MNTFESLKHTVWECKYHVVFIPKYRKRVLYQQLRREMGTVFRELAQRQESEIIEGHLMGGGATMWDNTFGREGIGYQRWERTKPRCAATSKSRRRKTNGWTRWS